MVRSLPRMLVGGAAFVGGLVTVALTAALAGGVWLGTGAGERWAEGQLERRVSALTDGGSLTIGGLSVGPRRLEADNVALSDATGRALVAIERIEAEWRPFDLVWRTVRAPSLRLVRPTIDLSVDDEGVLDVVRLFGGPGPGSDAPFSLPVALDLPQVAVEDLAARVRSGEAVWAVSNVDATFAVSGRDDRLLAADVALAGGLTEPAPAPIRATGAVGYTAADGLVLDGVALGVGESALTAAGRVGARVELAVAFDPLDGRSLDPLVGGIGLDGVWTGQLAARGERELQVTAALLGRDRADGAVRIEGTVDRGASPVAYAAEARFDALHVEALVGTLAEPVVLDGVVAVEGAGTSLATAAVTGRWQGGAQTLYGQAVDRVDAPFALADGVMSLEGAALDGIVGELGVTGTIDLVRGPLALTVDGPLSPARLEALGADGLDGAGRIDATIRGDLKAETSAFDIAGTVRYAPFVYGELAAARSLVAPFDVRAAGGGVRGDVRVVGRGVEALGVVADEVDAASLALDVRGADVTVTGPLTLRGAAYPGYATVAEAAVDLQYAKRGAHQAVDAQLGLGAYTVLEQPGTGGGAVVQVRDQDVSFDVALTDGGRPTLGTAGRYRIDTAALSLDRLAFAPTPRATWTAGPSTMRIVAGGVADAELLLRSELGTVALRGDVATQGALDGRVQLSSFQLDHLAELFPDRIASGGGTLDAVIDLRGEAEDPLVDASVDLRGLYLEDTVRWLDVSGRLGVEGGRLRPEGLVLGVAGEAFARVEGELPLVGGLAAPAFDPEGAVDLRVALLPGTFERLSRVSPALDGTAVPEGRFSGLVEATGALQDPELRLTGVSEIAVPGWGRAGRVELDVQRRASELTFSADLREGLATRATVAGSGATRLGDIVRYYVAGDGDPPDLADVDLYLSDVEAAAALVGVPAASLAAVAGSDVPLGGELVGGLSVRGSPLRPVLDGAVNWLSPSLGETALEGAYVALVPDAGGYTLDASVTFPEGGEIDVRGAVPVAVDFAQPTDTWAVGDLALDVSGEGIPLAALAALAPQVRDGRGTVSVAGRVGGTPFAPRPALTAAVADGALEIPALGVTAQAIDVGVRVEGDQLRVDHAEFELVPTRRLALDTELPGLARPKVRIVGLADLVGGAPGSIDARVTLTEGPWLAATESSTLRADGELRLTGTWPALSASGSLDVVAGRLELDAAALSGDAPLRLDPTLSIRRGEQPPIVAAPDAPPLYADFDVDIDVDLNRNLELTLAMPFVEDLGEVGAVLSSADLSTRLGGQVHVQMDGQAPTLVGEVEVVEGQVRVLRSNLALQEGTISFAGGDPYSDAILDLSGVMSVEGGDLELAIQGPLAAPTFETRSEAFPDPTEQWTILLTGQSPDELTAGQAEGAAQALAGLFVNSLLAGQALGTLSVQPDNSVRLGVPVTPTIYATSTFAPFADLDDNALSLEVEWSLARRVVASGGIGDQVQWGDLFWEIRF